MMVIQSLLTVVYVTSLASLVASLNMFKAALQGVLRSPVAFFDTTPMGKLILLEIESLINTDCAGRILSRLSKDQDTLDAQLSMTLYQVGDIVCLSLQIYNNLPVVPFYVQLRHRNRKYLRDVQSPS
jgi:hypothetical protein